MLKGTSRIGKRENANVLCRVMEVVDENELRPREIWFSCGRYKLKYDLIELLDRDKVDVSANDCFFVLNKEKLVPKNDCSPISNDCRLGR